MDRISRLPICIIESILCLIPIREAARTSILSKEWRYHWLKIPKLAFDVHEMFQVSTDGSGLRFKETGDRKEMSDRCKLFYAIYQVLLVHQGPIHDFTLHVYADDTCVEIDHILLHLLKKNTIKILKLDLEWGYPLPSSFFSFHQLTDLYLDGCVINIDHLPSFTGFSSLTTLNLQDVSISEKTLRRLLSSCPLLKRLTIDRDDSIDTDDDTTIAGFMECLPAIEYLSIWFTFYLCFAPFPSKVSTTLVHLKYLRVRCLSFGHKCSLPFLVLLIRSASNLEKLKISAAKGFVDDEDVGLIGSSKLKGYSDISLENLNELEITNFSDLKNGLAFVKLILAKSPVLKKVRIFLRGRLDKDEKLQVSKTLLSFSCASPLVKVIVS